MRMPRIAYRGNYPTTKWPKQARYSCCCVMFCTYIAWLAVTLLLVILYVLIEFQTLRVKTIVQHYVYFYFESSMSGLFSVYFIIIFYTVYMVVNDF